MAFPTLGSFLISSSGGSVLDLGGGEWKATNSNGSIHIPATVPGMIQMDLFGAGVINDPYYSNNCTICLVLCSVITATYSDL